MQQAFAGIDIGGTKIAAILADESGEVIAKRRIATRSELGPYGVFEDICRMVTDLVDENAAKLVAVGVGSPAPIDVDNGLILSPSNLRDWDEFPIVNLLRERFGVPVMLDNDANAAALGEYLYGAGRGYSNIFYVTFSTGIGGGLILNGEIYHGVTTGAGEIGHTIVKPDGIRCNCGSTGCLETICAGIHIARRAKERLAAGEPSIMHETAPDDINARTVVEALRQNDPLAADIWDETCTYLAIGIGNAITLFAPEIVIIGGGIASAGELLFEPLRRMMPQFVSMIPASKINIVPAELGTESGTYGAVAIARSAYSRRPTHYVA